MNKRQTAENRYLVVGADSMIGEGLVSFLVRIGADVDGTTRRKETAIGRRLFFDLASENTMFVFEKSYDCIFLCAGVTTLSACEDEPEKTHHVNVTNMLRIAKRFQTNGTRIVYLSSNAVFNGKTVRPNENADYCAVTQYGRQKALTESGLMAFSAEVGSVAIVRLSKVLSPASGIAAKFLIQLKDEKPFKAFDDLLISPVSLEYVLSALLKIASSKLTGVFHLSGAEEMTYSEFSKRLAEHMSVDPAIVLSCSLINEEKTALFQPEHPALGMKRTSELLDIYPEPTEHLMNKLVQ